MFFTACNARSATEGQGLSGRYVLDPKPAHHIGHCIGGAGGGGFALVAGASQTNTLKRDIPVLCTSKW